MFWQIGALFPPFFSDLDFFLSCLTIISGVCIHVRSRRIWDQHYSPIPGVALRTRNAVNNIGIDDSTIAILVFVFVLILTCRPPYMPRKGQHEILNLENTRLGGGRSFML